MSPRSQGLEPGPLDRFTVLVKLLAGDSGAIEMAKADTGKPDQDALTWYASLFDDIGMENHTAGVNTLRHLFVLLIGLGMRESSGRHCEGRDRSASNVTQDTAEAGLFQTSFNASRANELLPQLFQHYLRHPSGFLEVFKDGVACRPSDLENFGTGDGREFQRLSKECPAFAAEFAGIGLRHRRKHWGPINRKEIQLVPECDALLRNVQRSWMRPTSVRFCCRDDDQRARQERIECALKTGDEWSCPTYL